MSLYDIISQTLSIFQAPGWNFRDSRKTTRHITELQTQRRAQVTYQGSWHCIWMYMNEPCNYLSFTLTTPHNTTQHLKTPQDATRTTQKSHHISQCRTTSQNISEHAASMLHHVGNLSQDGEAGCKVMSWSHVRRQNRSWYVMICHNIWYHMRLHVVLQKFKELIAPGKMMIIMS